MKLDNVGGVRRPDPLNVHRDLMLPDDVMLNILERVGTLDAIRTCFTSKQTIKLLTKISQIVIVLSARELVRKNGVVADVTDMILSARLPQIPIRNLKLKFFMRGDDHLKIGRSVALAMARQKVEAAEFQILTTKCVPNCTLSVDIIAFAKQFSAFIGECPDAFGGLTRLHLQCMRFGESDIQNILSTCKLLESLSFILCDSGVRSLLQVEHARLVELDITRGYFRTVELNYLPKLQRMSYRNWHYTKNPLVIGYVPRLSNLSLGNGYVDYLYGYVDYLYDTIKLSQLLVNVPSIIDLHLDFQHGKVWLHQESGKLLAPLLDKLRILNLDNIPEESGIAWTLSFLEAAPSLEELCITVSDHKCQLSDHKCQTESPENYSKKTDVKWEPSVAGFKHKNLAKLTIHGFESNDNFIRYTRCIMKVAENIQEVSLHDRKACMFCCNKSRPWRYPRTRREKDWLSKKITEALVTASPDVIQFRPSCHYSYLDVEYYEDVVN